MTLQQFVEEIKRLSVAERLELLEIISRNVREDLKSRTEGVRVAPPESGQTEGQASAQDEVPLSQRLRGIVKFDGDPPTDEELKDAYADYLMEKYS